MKKIISYFIKYHFAVNIIILEVVIFGYLGTKSMKSSFFPLTESQFINISVIYPGASPQEMEEAAYEFTAFFGETGEMHKGDNLGDLVESIAFTEEKIEKLGLPPGSLPVGWWVGFHVPDETFAKVKKGELTMFSIQGDAQRRFAKRGDKTAADFRQRMKRHKKKRNRRRAQDVLSGDLRMGKTAKNVTINIGDSAIQGKGKPEVNEDDGRRVGAAARAAGSGRRPTPEQRTAVADAARQTRERRNQAPAAAPAAERNRSAARPVRGQQARRNSEQAPDMAGRPERQPGRPRRPRSESARQDSAVQER